MSELKLYTDDGMHYVLPWKGNNFPHEYAHNGKQFELQSIHTPNMNSTDRIACYNLKQTPVAPIPSLTFTPSSGTSFNAPSNAIFTISPNQSVGGLNFIEYDDKDSFKITSKPYVCECGAVKCRTTHAHWCPMYKAYK